MCRHTVDSIGDLLRNIAILLLRLLLLLLLLVLLLLLLQLLLFSLLLQFLLLMLLVLLYLARVLLELEVILFFDGLEDPGDFEVFRIVCSNALLFHLFVLLLGC